MTNPPNHLSRRAVIGNVASATVLGSLLSVVGTAPAMVKAKGVSDTDLHPRKL